MIYFIAALEDPECLVKIGFTKDNVEKRIDALQTGSPLRLRLLVTLEGDRSLERLLHSMFSQERRHGEWFFPSLRLRSFLRSLLRPQLDGLIAQAMGDPRKQEQYAQALGWSEESVQEELMSLRDA